ELSADKGTFTENIYYPKEAGTITITGTYSGKVATATIIVIGGAVHSFRLFLSPNSISVPTKGTFTISIIPYDRHNNQTTYNGTATISDLTGSLNPNQTGIINKGWNGSFTITQSINGGILIITAILGTMIEVASITVYIEPNASQTIGSDYGTITPIETGSLTEAFRIVISDAKNSATFTTTEPAEAIGLCIDVKIIGSSGAEFHGSFTICVAIPYNEANLGNIDERTLRLYTFNEQINKWELVPNSWVDIQNNIVNGTLTHLTLIAPIAGFERLLAAEDLNSVIVYPNPCKQYPTITFKNLTRYAKISIFNIAGEKIKEFEATGNGEYPWTIPKDLASGVYIYIIKNNFGQKAIGKFAIIK
ncbi:MAG: T9SS type A sorting domain-containing protein, partial [bacterium]